jgi:hypothetical protein
VTAVVTARTARAHGGCCCQQPGGRCAINETLCASLTKCSWDTPLHRSAALRHVPSSVTHLVAQQAGEDGLLCH